MIDVCLILEGTYPYVAGGVSTWVHQLITAMKDIRFGIIYIAPHSDPTRRVKYVVPSQVLYLKEIYLHDYRLNTPVARNPTPADYAFLKEFHWEMSRHKYDRLDDFVALFAGKKACFNGDIFFSSPEIWEMLMEFNDHFASDISFLDFFWTWRGIQLPLIQLLNAEIPRAKIYHSVSTGYAGLLGSIAKHLYGSKFFLTEHGIYTHERMLEISQANWIYERERSHYRAERDLSFFKKWWIGLFQTMSRIAYGEADQIFTLFEGNKTREILEGAPAELVKVIPNGIDIVSHGAIPRVKLDRPQVGLIGRVVSIKDIKTFIQAARNVLDWNPDIDFLVIGPTDEEPEYFEECKILAEALQMGKNFTFTGRMDLRECYKSLDVVVLTSVSEAQPYVILEANLLGIPMVATDVGACREMLEGQNPLDRSLGPSGLLTDVASPGQTARAIIRLLSDKNLYAQCAKAGIERVKKFYDQDDLLSRYMNLYEKNM